MLSRSRAIWLSSLALTGAGFIVDKAFLGGAASGPSSASAAAPSAAAPASQPARTTPSPANVSSGPTAAQRGQAIQAGLEKALAALPQGTPPGDAFAMPGEWLAALDAARPSAAPSAPMPAALPAPLPRISAIIRATDGARVKIDGKFYREADQIGPFTIRKIADRAVVFEHEGVEHTAQLSE
jgi:hypothetical protein